MSTWKENLLPASFRNVPFHVESSQYSGGRRAVVSEYPGREIVQTEDLGRKAREFELEAFVIGSEYHTKRDALRAALEEPDPGLLVHPHYGKITVACIKFSIRENLSSGGMAVFSLSFVETTAVKTLPSLAAVNTSGVKTGSANLLTKLRSVFNSAYRTGQLTSNLQDHIRNFTTTVSLTRMTLQMPVQDLANLRKNVQDCVQNLETLISTPGDLFDQLQSIISFLPTRKAVRQAASFTPGTRPQGATEEQAIEQLAYDTLAYSLGLQLGARSSYLLAEEEFASYEEAVTARNDTIALLESYRADADDEVYRLLSKLIADTVLAIPSVKLPRLIRRSTTSSMPLIAFVYELYGDLDRLDDLEERNHLVRPGFLPFGTEIEVLTR